MKKLKLIYNPKSSGNKSLISQFDDVIDLFQLHGYDINIFRISSLSNIDCHMKTISDYDSVIVCGGDGTLNLIINSMVYHGVDLPVGVIPVGTANDFANFLNMPSDILECCKIILKNKTKRIDIGEVVSSADEEKRKIFINVCAGGLFSNVSQTVNSNLKNTLGKLSYYIKGIEQLPGFTPIPIKITTSNDVLFENVFFFIALNGGGAGGFEKISPFASIDDGVIDFIAVRAVSIKDIALLFLKVLKGEHLDDDSIIHFQDKYIKIELLSECKDFSITDIDGELGPSMPIEITVRPKAVTMYTNL